MHILLALGLCVLNFVWLVLTAAGLPGNWLMVGSALLTAWLWRPGLFSTPVLIAIGVLASLGEVLELVTGAAAARRAGGTRRGAIGALLGAVVGGILGSIFLLFIPVIGSLLGACAGAAIGALLFELHGGAQFNLAMRSGVGAGLGRLGGTLAKLAVGVAIWLVITIAAFWP